VASPFSEPEPCIRLWRVDSGELAATISVEGEISPTETKVVFSGNGQWLAAACDDGTTRVWSIKP
jgi:WD40 repeat protein